MGEAVKGQRTVEEIAREVAERLMGRGLCLCGRALCEGTHERGALTSMYADLIAAPLRSERERGDRLAAELADLKAQQIQVNTWGLGLMDGLGKFLQKVVEGGPQTSVIHVDFPDNSDIPVVHLWATTDEQEPAARCRLLAGQRDSERKRAEAAEARAKKLEEALRLTEWGDLKMFDGKRYDYCPWCQCEKGVGHSSDCPVRRALAEQGEE